MERNFQHKPRIRNHPGLWWSHCQTNNNNSLASCHRVAAAQLCSKAETILHLCSSANVILLWNKHAASSPKKYRRVHCHNDLLCWHLNISLFVSYCRGTNSWEFTFVALMSLLNTQDWLSHSGMCVVYFDIQGSCSINIGLGIRD